MIFEDNSGFASTVSQKAGANVPQIVATLRKKLESIPSTSGGNMEEGSLGAGPDLKRVWEAAQVPQRAIALRSFGHSS